MRLCCSQTPEDRFSCIEAHTCITFVLDLELVDDIKEVCGTRGESMKKFCTG